MWTQWGIVFYCMKNLIFWRSKVNILYDFENTSRQRCPNFRVTLKSPSMGSKGYSQTPRIFPYLNSVAISFCYYAIVLFILIQLIHVFFQQHVFRFSIPLSGRVELFDTCKLILKSHQLSYREALRNELGGIFFFFFDFDMCLERILFFTSSHTWQLIFMWPNLMT